VNWTDLVNNVASRLGGPTPLTVRSLEMAMESIARNEVAHGMPWILA
jgi:hypothetical protein